MKPEFNIVLITVDALRKDRLPFYGCDRDTAPCLSGFARDSVIFDRMYSQYVSTPPSMASLMTGKYPSFIGIDRWDLSNCHGLSRFFEDPDEKGIPNALPTLAERLKDAGFDTAGLIASNSYLFESFGFEKGNDLFKTVRGPFNNCAWGVVNKAIEWLEDRDSGAPFFLWLHLMDVHAPIILPHPFNRAFRRKYLKGNDIDLKVSESLLKIETDNSERRYTGTLDPESILDLGEGQKARLEQAVNHYQGLYDNAINFMDLCLEKFFTFFKRRDLYDRTLWAFTSDHGEEFLEDGYLFHSAHSHGPARLVQVPFIFRPPFIEESARGKRVSRLARLVDLFPTVMEAAGVPCPDTDGSSLLPLIAGTEDRERFQHMSLMAQEKLHVIYFRDFKYVYSLDKRREKVTVLPTGKEVEIRPEEMAGLVRMFRTERDEFLARNKGARVSLRPFRADAEMQSQLRSLGYID